MTKQTSLSDSFYVGSAELSGDVGALSSILASRAVLDVSAINKIGYERLLGRSDGSMAFNAFWNPSAGQSHLTLSPIGTAAGTVNTIVTYVHGATVGNDAASLQAVQVDYPITIGADYSFGMAVQAQGAAGAPVEWGVMLTPALQTFGSAGTVATVVDGGGSISFGAAAYLHVISIDSGTATVAVQDAAVSSYSNVTGLVFAPVTGPTFQRLATTTTATIRRYRRINVTGTFTNLVAFVNLVVYPTSQT